MEGFIMRAIQLAFFCLIILQTVPSLSQYQVTSVRASENGNYNSILNQFDIEEIRKGILASWKHGENPRSYWNESMEATFQRGGNLERTLRPQVNQAFLRLLKDLALGSVDPQSLTSDVKFVQKNFFTPQQLQVIALAAVGVEGFIEKVSPQNAPYMAVKEAMQKLYPSCGNNEWKEIAPPNVILRLYSRHSVVIEIKNRLSLLGYKFKNKDDLFDGDLQAAVTDIQWGMRINPDGVISPKGKVWAFLSVPCLDRVRQLQVDMEKMRWFPQYFEKRYVFVNLAMSYFILIDQSNPDWERVMSFRTVNGRPARKSPTMRDEIVKVIINPFWVVPPTIFWEDKVNDLRNLTKPEIAEYFNTRHYEAWTGDFRRRVDPTTIDWAGISAGRANGDINIRQLPHLGNALGVLKFDLTNSFAIYLHDTNQRELFNEPARQLSSGCIRLEKPLDLAEYLLEDTPWDRATIASMMARPGEVMAKSTEIPVPKHKITPVYTVYQTSLMSSDGIIRFVDDIYGQNAAIRARLRGLF
jgi:murein L,D-transpeptidase YcbB/YkuD